MSEVVDHVPLGTPDGEEDHVPMGTPDGEEDHVPMDTPDGEEWCWIQGRDESGVCTRHVSYFR